MGIRPSYQRLRVLAYLRACSGHPTAEEIYTHVASEIPTLSRATVYSTLHAFAAAGLIDMLDTIDGAVRYDTVLADHGHFRCDRCGTLVDFSLSLDQVGSGTLEGYRVRKKHVTFKGLCPACITTLHQEE